MVSNVGDALVSADLASAANPNIPDGSVSNSTMALAPGETAFVTLRAALSPEEMAELVRGLTPVVTAHGTNTNGSVPDFAALLFIQTPGGTTLPAALVGTPYSTTLLAAGGKAPLTWSLAPGKRAAGRADAVSGRSDLRNSVGLGELLVHREGHRLDPGHAADGQPDVQPGGRRPHDRHRDRLRREPGRRGPDDVRDRHGHRHAGQRDAVEPDRHGRPDRLRALGHELRPGSHDGQRFGLPGDGDPDGGGYV